MLTENYHYSNEISSTDKIVLDSKFIDKALFDMACEWPYCNCGELYPCDMTAEERLRIQSNMTETEREAAIIEESSKTASKPTKQEKKDKIYKKPE